ncbi:MAG: phytanoyl-CoA dioxygenase family protein [Alphaproteobacteria bacterium]|nr:phytanoyl-CoA dioxygenase family protein [Alphaproteobacteria bacterium]
MILEQDIARYHETGYLVVPDVLDADILARVRGALDKLVADAASVVTHTDVYDLEPGHTPEVPKVRRIKFPDKHTPVFWELANYRPMVEILEQLLGPSGVRLQSSKINLKAPHYGSPVEWHQDWAFYPHTNDDMLAVGVMLDDAFLENGPLMVVPGSHKGPTWNHHSNGVFCGAMDPTRKEVDFESAVPLTGKAGAMSFHHVRMVHGSAQNVSDKPRRLLLYEFSAGDAFPLMGIKDWDQYNRNLVSGTLTHTPRIVPTPVRVPLPPAPFQGSIYENQTTLENKYFARRGTAPDENSKQPAKV